MKENYYNAFFNEIEKELTVKAGTPIFGSFFHFSFSENCQLFIYTKLNFYKLKKGRKNN